MSIRRRHARRHKAAATELNITAFMNLMVILVPFLLITAVFSRLAILQMNLPDADAKAPETPPEITFNLEVQIQAKAMLVLEAVSGFNKTLPAADTGPTASVDDYDFAGLAETIEGLKAKHPEQKSIRLVFAPNTNYDVVFRTTETVRAKPAMVAGQLRFAELFPNVSMATLPEAPAAEALEPAASEETR